MINYVQTMEIGQLFATLLAGFLALALTLGFHEASHAYVAHKAGDLTPKAYGRLTLNPFKHFDLMGTICLLIFGFGWAKPVPINPYNFKKPRRDFFAVSSAGILSNLLLAFVSFPFYLLLSKFANLDKTIMLFLTMFFLLFISYNINFAIFNLLPIFPLDGFNIVVSLSKTDNGYLRFMRRYGWVVLLVIVLFFGNWLFYVSDLIFGGINWFWELII